MDAARAGCQGTGAKRKAGLGTRLCRSTTQVEGCSGARPLCRAGMLGAQGDLSRGRRLGLRGGVE